MIKGHCGRKWLGTAQCAISCSARWTAVQMFESRIDLVSNMNHTDRKNEYALGQRSFVNDRCTIS